MCIRDRYLFIRLIIFHCAYYFSSPSKVNDRLLRNCKQKNETFSLLGFNIYPISTSGLFLFRNWNNSSKSYIIALIFTSLYTNFNVPDSIFERSRILPINCNSKAAPCTNYNQRNWMSAHKIQKKQSKTIDSLFHSENKNLFSANILLSLIHISEPTRP